MRDLMRLLNFGTQRSSMIRVCCPTRNFVRNTLIRPDTVEDNILLLSPVAAAMCGEVAVDFTIKTVGGQ
jgi:hypothetical protein